jgi:glucose/arabinose dehydrogenase
MFKKMLCFAALAGTVAMFATNVEAGGTALTTERVGVGFSFPTSATMAPGDSERMFVTEKASGRVRILNLSTGVINPVPFLDIGSPAGCGDMVGFGTTSTDERGLLGLAFHPEYQTNGFFYVFFFTTANQMRIARFTVSAGDPDVAVCGSQQNIVTVSEPFGNHNGGTIHFGPDGMLYASLGDGGSGGDPGDRAQNPNIVLGKMLRLDVDGGTPYAIPPDNPFAAGGGLGEIWHLGLRNPWAWSFDRETGDMYIGDVGQNTREEIDFAPAGVGGINYGWKCKEGIACFSASAFCTCATGTLVDPIYDFAQSTGMGRSITGGRVYRGCAISDLDGTYFFSDWITSRIWSFRYDGAALTDFTERTFELAPGGGLSISGVVNFTEDTDGEIYIIDHVGGEIFKIIRADGETDCVSTSPGDCDDDGDVDLVDFGTFQLCFNGPGVAIGAECGCADFDGDNDVDLTDFGQLQLAFTGPM